MDKGESIGALYVEIKAQDEITKELKQIQREAARGADNIEDQFKSLRLSIRTDLMKKSMSQIRNDYGKLKQEFDKKLELDANYEDLEKLKVELEESETALKRFTKETHKAEKEIDEGFISKAKSKFGALASSLSALFAGVAIGAFFKSSVEAFFESEKAAAGLEQQLGYTSDALNEYAAAIQNTTVFEDDLVIAAMTRIAAFTKDEEQIKALTDAALDLAAAKGMDLASAADMVAKTFGSETNALARSGIEIDAVAGSTERLAQVTEGIARLYGGQAAAQANTYAGKVEILKNKFGDLKEEIGSKMAPALGALSTYFSKTTDKMKDAGKSSNTLKDTFNAVAIVGISLFTSLKIVWIGLTTLIGGVIGFANLGITAISAPFRMFINLIKSISDLGPTVMAIIRGDWANVNFGAIATAAKKAVMEPIQDIGGAVDRMVAIGKRGWGQIKDEIELAKSFGSQLKYQDFLANQEQNSGVNPEVSTIGSEATNAEQDAQKLKELEELKLRNLEEYYGKVKWLDADYQKYREGKIDEEVKKYQEAKGKEFDAAKFKSDELKKLYLEQEQFYSDESKTYLTSLEEMFRKSLRIAKESKAETSQLFFRMFNLDPGYGTASYGQPQGDGRPRGMTEGGLLTEVKNPNKGVTGLEYLEDFSALNAMELWTEGTVQGKLAWESLGKAVGDTLSLIKIQVGENASAVTQIWATMINSMIDGLAGLLAKWLLFNTLASFLPGAGFGAVSFKSLLGISEKAATGGNFLGTNNGVLRLAAGGDFVVPQGFPNDSYPMLVQSGERVKVTPSGKIGEEARLLAEIKNAIEANTLDRRMLGSQPVIVQPKIQIGSRDLTKEMKKSEKVIAREGWKQE